MLHHFKHAFNSLKKNKIYTLINISGLALGMGVAMALIMTIIGMSGMDKFHVNKENVYKLIHADDSVTKNYGDASSALLAPVIKEEIPEVVDYCQYLWANDKILGSPENYVKQNGFYADEGWFRMLSFPLVYGNIEHILSKPDHIALSRKLSEKLFGNENPIGRNLKLYSYESAQPELFTVSGVFENVNQVSSLQFEFVVPFSYFLNQNPNARSWNYIGTRSYIQVKPNTDTELLSKKITSLVRSKNPGMEAKQVFGLAPLYKSNQFVYNLSGELSFGYFIMIAMGIVGLSILIISFINYINLSVATSLKRSKEIGVRKINGAGRKELVIQFFIETFLVVLTAGILASFLHSYLLNIFMVEKLPLISYINKTLFFIFATLLVLTVLITAWYPAAYISRFSPLKLQKKTSDGKNKLSFSRRSMVTLQFITAIFLITTSVILSDQVDFLINKSMGMDRHHIVYFTKSKQLDQHRDAFTQELQTKPGIESITYANQLPFEIGNATTSVYWEGKDSQANEWFSIINVGESFTRTMKIELMEGKDFSDDQYNKILINQAASEKMNIPNPVGSHISMHGKNTEIIGVVKNFNFMNMRRPDLPLYICYAPENAEMAFVRLQEGNETEGLKSLKEVYSHFSPDFILDYTFLDNKFQERYSPYKKMKYIITIAGYLAVVIACLGLLGLTVHTSERRLKEIGVRRINGAKITDLVSILSSQMLGSILTAALIGFPLIYFINKIILENFAEHIKVSAFQFLWSICIIFGLTILIVGWQIIKAARRNPVEALRYE